MGGGDANPDSNVVKGTVLLNNHYASMLFDSGVDRKFMSTTFSTLLDMILDTLDISYAVELADGRIFETNTILRGCTLGLLGHPFNIDLMPVELGSFDVIIGMDLAPVTAGKPRGTTQEVTRGHLMIGMSDGRSEELFIQGSECGRADGLVRGMI
ncbi:putative reverse transcriptase domain-containing protein [Tanacetum coccineum]